MICHWELLFAHTSKHTLIHHVYPSCPGCSLHKGRNSVRWSSFLMSLVPTTQCLSVVASYHGHVVGTSLGKWKLVITSVSYALWCNNSRRRLLRVRPICLLGNRHHLSSSPSLMGGGRLCTIYRFKTNKTPLCFQDGISNTTLSYWPYLAVVVFSLYLNTPLLHLDENYIGQKRYWDLSPKRDMTQRPEEKGFLCGDGREWHVWRRTCLFPLWRLQRFGFTLQSVNNSGKKNPSYRISYRIWDRGR